MSAVTFHGFSFTNGELNNDEDVIVEEESESEEESEEENNEKYLEKYSRECAQLELNFNDCCDKNYKNIKKELKRVEDEKFKIVIVWTLDSLQMILTTILKKLFISLLRLTILNLLFLL